MRHNAAHTTAMVPASRMLAKSEMDCFSATQDQRTVSLEGLGSVDNGRLPC